MSKFNLSIYKFKGGISIIKILRTGELKIKVHSKKYAKELIQIIKNENIMINMKTK